MSRRRSMHDDEGVSLLLALALVVCVGLIVGAIASYAGVSISTVGAGQEALQRSYDVDGALQAAVDELRVSEYDQDENLPMRCFGLDPDDDVIEVPPSDGAGKIAVRCTPKPGTGADSSKVKITENNRFADGIFAGSGGLRQDVEASVLVRGDLRSSAEIRVDGTPCTSEAGYPGGGTTCGGLWADGKVRAASCQGTVESVVGVKECDAGAAMPSEGSPTPGSSVVYRFVSGSCPSSRTLRPGYYDDAEALSDLTGGCSTTARVVFEPGTYYFDFRNDDSRAADAGPLWPIDHGPNEWVIDNPNLTVVGGQPTGDLFKDGACVSPLKHSSAQGVRFVFGHDSRLTIKQGTVSLCGTYSLADRPIVLQGATAGTNDDTNDDPPQDGTPSGATSGSISGGTFSPADPGSLAQAVSFPDDGEVALATLTRQPTGPQQVWAEFTGYFAQPASIPAGAILTSATVQLNHQEAGALPGDSLRVTFAPNGGTPALPVPAPEIQPTLGADSFDLLTPTLANRVHRFGLNGGRLRYELNSAPGTGDIHASLDLARLTFSWIPPGIREQKSGTLMLQTSGAATRVRIDGSVHTRHGDVDLQLRGVDYPVVSSGLVARGVTLGIVPVTGWRRPVIQTPRLSDGPAPLAVYLVAYVCDGSCTPLPPGSGWRPVGTASARFKDTDSIPGAPDREVTVDSWHLGP